MKFSDIGLKMPSRILLTLCSCILWTVIHSNPLQRGKVDARAQNTAVGYLTRHGYLAMPDARAGQLRTNEELKEGIKMFQLYAGIPMTGVVDDKTMEMMEMPRCGMPDFGRSDRTKRRRRYAVQGTVWEKKELTYMIQGGPSNTISESEVHEQVEKAFKEWERISTLKFSKSQDPNADILVRFRSGMHDDGYPFDGPGGTLAHGFYPHNNLGLSGDVHFDDDETWILKKGERGTDFYWTALHEIGHALGLDHSNYIDAVMYPFYTGFKDNLQLNEDDINGIHYLYGMPIVSVHTAPPSHTDMVPTNGPSGAPHPCSNISFDAIFAHADRMTYFFSGKYFWKVHESERNEGPFVIKQIWPELPDEGIDAAYQSGGNITFFKGKSCWVYYGTRYLAGPLDISEHFMGLDRSVSRIDAAFVWGANGKTYLFSGDDYWKYNEALGRVEMGYPAKIANAWLGVPNHLDSAMTWINGKTYFFKRGGFWIFDNLHIRTTENEPMMTSAYWMKCNLFDNSGSSRSSKSIVLLFISALAFVLN